MKHESLALRSNLKKRGVPLEDTKCFFYVRADEDGGHLFIKCKFAKVVWRELEIEKERMDLEDIPYVHHALDYIWNLSEVKRMHILTFWWLWWSNRNKLREGEMPDSTEVVARRTKANVLEYMHIYNKPKPGKSNTQWRPPRGDFIKINMDSSFIVGQDDSGWAELGLVRVIFEIDCTLLLEAMDLARVDASPYAAVIEDLKFQLKIWFSKYEISVCRREANAVVHQLASLGRMYESNHYEEWESLVPAQVAVCVEGDLPQHR
ncbi:hypothetical protein D1007_41208 [Hordeum vulgare]|nr:hypothetical protein D1007_41208 [Hordeum vulgare]